MLAAVGSHQSPTVQTSLLTLRIEVPSHVPKIAETIYSLVSHKKDPELGETHIMKMSFLDKESNFPSNNFRSANYSGKWQRRFIDEYVDSIFEKGIDEANKEFSESKNEHIPDSLYKFYPPSIYSLASIQNRNIFLSSSKTFNDPFDSFICVDDQPYIKSFLLKAFSDNEMTSKASTSNSFSDKEFDNLKYAPINGRYKKEFGYSDDFRSRLYHICLTKSDEFRLKVNSIHGEIMIDSSRKVDLIRNIPFRITCFSHFDDEAELGQNTTMWSHYAENHTGFCVKYSTNCDSIVYSDIIKCGLFSVIYTSRVPKLTLQDFKKLKFSGEDLEVTPSVLKKCYKALITKSKFWGYENEWRLIIHDKNEVQLSYETLPFLNIEAIYLGCRINHNIKKSLVQFAEISNIDIFLAKQSDEHFQLDFYNVSTKKMKDDEYYSKLSKYNRIKDESIRRRNIIPLEEMFKQ